MSRVTDDPAPDAPLLQVRGLTKYYGARAVVDNLDLDLMNGEILGILGANGAGKTTLLRMLYGFLTPDAGTILYRGRDFQRHRSAAKRVIGVCSQDDTLDQELTVRENLEIYGHYFRPRIARLGDRVSALLDRFQLTEYADALPPQLSGGYRQRLMIARSLIHDPSVLFLDEPTTGLDPKARVRLWEVIDGLRKDGIGTILTTHYMDEAQVLSDRLLVLERGVALTTGTVAVVLGELLAEHVVVVANTSEHAHEIRAWIEQRTGAAPDTVLDELRIYASATLLSEFAARFSGVAFAVRPPNLDDLFLQLGTVPANVPGSEVGNAVERRA